MFNHNEGHSRHIIKNARLQHKTSEDRVLRTLGVRNASCDVSLFVKFQDGRLPPFVDASLMTDDASL
jgi:hypothetical protein